MQAKTEHGFTLIELIIVIVIIAILATFAFPVFISVQERANITRDMNNLRQIAFGTLRYLNDNDGTFFPNTGPTWMTRLCPPISSTAPYVADWGVFQSPWDTRTRTQSATQTPVSYGVNNYPNSGPFGVDTSKIINPVAFILFAPAQNTSQTIIGFQGTAARVGEQKFDELGHSLRRHPAKTTKDQRSHGRWTCRKHALDDVHERHVDDCRPKRRLPVVV